MSPLDGTNLDASLPVSSPDQVAPADTRTSGRAYWRSLDELEGTPEFRAFMDKEFPSFNTGVIPESTRRSFLRVMGASVALAGLTGCRWPREEILPFANRPEYMVPGTPRHFATAFELGGVARSVVATSMDGRPIKIEGNDLNPESLGATDVYTQATVLDLYDPDRSTRPARSGTEGMVNSTWVEAAGELGGILRATGGDRVAVLCEATSSETFASLRERFKQTFPKASWYEYEAISRDNEREGLRSVFRAPFRQQVDLQKAKIVVDLGADLLGSHPSSLRNARAFADGRREFAAADITTTHDGHFEPNRLYVAEAGFSITGGIADQRAAMRPAMLAVFVLRLAAQLQDRGIDLGNDLRTLVELGMNSRFAAAHEAMLVNMADDLVEHKGGGLVAVSSLLPPQIHAVCAVINERLGNTGSTVHYSAAPDPDRVPHHQSIAELTDKMHVGIVDTLIIIGGNPAYDAPGDCRFPEALRRVAISAHLSPYRDETSSLCTWHLPRSHYLESWGDVRSWAGVLSVTQPLISPLFDTLSSIELMSMLIDDTPQSGYELVRKVMLELQSGGMVTEYNRGFEIAWRDCLHNGFVSSVMWALETPQVNLNLRDWIEEELLAINSWAIPASGGRVAVVFNQDSKTYDGRYANNGWLQELPDPLTKLTWDNAAVMSPRSAELLEVTNEDVVSLRTEDGAALEVPVYILPGLADGMVQLSRGYGRSFGRVGKDVGIDISALSSSKSPGMVRNVTVSRVWRKHKLATTQSHHGISTLNTKDEVGSEGVASRLHELLREETVEQYNHHPLFAKHGQSETRSLWEEPLGKMSPDHRWAMSIDLNTCTGCSACVVACVAENNIPVVGKSEVLMGREMHWLRVDRYFSGEVADPGVAFQPVPCQQCESAPCEQVCPAAATTHSEEGLNDMVYNRCVGTRYCSNNCPYKVRRFNYWNNHIDQEPVQQMVLNPDVTVRGRGVMEKCTYCVQRISRAKIPAKNEGRLVRDGEIMPACGQACPTGAIAFGNLEDADSRVSKLFKHNRSYSMLNELNVKPRTRYLARLRNPKVAKG